MDASIDAIARFALESSKQVIHNISGLPLSEHQPEKPPNVAGPFVGNIGGLGDRCFYNALTKVTLSDGSTMEMSWAVYEDDGELAGESSLKEGPPEYFSAMSYNKTIVVIPSDTPARETDPRELKFIQ